VNQENLDKNLLEQIQGITQKRMKQRSCNSISGYSKKQMNKTMSIDVSCLETVESEDDGENRPCSKK
jgi:hypothetical protein